MGAFDYEELGDAEKVAENIASFKKDLAQVINKHSMGSCSDTPDFVLADYLYNCLQAYNTASFGRLAFFNPGPRKTFEERITEAKGGLK